MTRSRSGSLAGSEEQSMSMVKGAEGADQLIGQCLQTMARGSKVMNPLLSYVAFRMNTASVDVIKIECVEFYSSEEILKARDALWGIEDDDVKKTIPKIIRRHGMDQRKGCEQTLVDICAALSILDDEDKMPCFSVDFADLARIPSTRKAEVCNDIVLERLARLEGRMEAMEKTSQRTPSANPKHYSKVVASAAASDDTTVKQAPSDNRSNAVSRQSPTHESSPDNDGFTTQGRRRRQKKPPIRGNAPSLGSLKGAPEPSRDIFVYRLLPEIDESMVGKHMLDSNVQVRDIKQMSKEESRFKSFQITVTRPDLPKVLKPNFWPEGVCVRRFFAPREKRNDG